MVKIEKYSHIIFLITLIGGILVWIGWYGFNTGSAYTLNDVALTSFVQYDYAQVVALLAG